MKIQLAVDRVTIDEAKRIIDEAEAYIDIIEIGTSLFLDYGLESLRQLRKQYNHTILADIKTMDEAEYEFRQIYTSGGDIATVMGASSMETIRISQQIAQEFNKEYMIDILEVSDKKIRKLAEFEDAIICLHLPKDKKGNLHKYIRDFVETHQLNNRLAAAGGITEEDLPYLKEAEIEIAVVGSSITKSENIREKAKSFKENA